MRSTVPMSRVAIAGVLLVGLVAMSGCSWLRKDNALYTSQTRPLEVPPDLPAVGATATAATAPAGPVTASGTVASARAGANTGFKMTESRDDAYTRLDGVLSGLEGVTIANRAKLLGAFDVNFQETNFLIRVSASEGGAYVSAVDPRGMPADGAAAVQLVAALKAAVGGQ